MQPKYRDFDPLFFPNHLPGSLPFYKQEPKKKEKFSFFRLVFILGLILILLHATSYFRQKSFQLGKAASWKPEHDHNSDEDWIFFAATKSFYRPLFGSYNFTECASICKGLKSQLTSIHNPEENEFIFNITNTGRMTGEHEANTWIGIYRLKENSTEWKNIDGTTVDYLNWDSFGKGEPNNDGGHENCVELYSDKSCPEEKCRAKWNDLNCDVKMRACACKRPGYWRK